MIILINCHDKLSKVTTKGWGNNKVISKFSSVINEVIFGCQQSNQLQHGVTSVFINVADFQC